MLAQARATDEALQKLPQQGPGVAAPTDAADTFRRHMLKMVRVPASLLLPTCMDITVLEDDAAG